VTDTNIVVVSAEEPNRVLVPLDDPNHVIVTETYNRVVVSAAGAQGVQGYSLISGDGAPGAGDGSVGDIYVDIDTGSFYGPKTSSGWPATPFYVPGATIRHVHTQASVSATWTINHSLGGYPSVTVVDTASTVVYGEVSYISTTQVRVVFSAPFSGFAYLT
jgi:hypothetical protein